MVSAKTNDRGFNIVLGSVDLYCCLMVKIFCENYQEKIWESFIYTFANNKLEG